MKKNRLNIIFLLMFVSFCFLIARLFDLTIINGQKYRDFSNNNRIKEINTEATRGKIYDRNGNVLASNEAVYNLIIYGDRFYETKDEHKNSSIENIVKILDEEGVNYLEEYYLDAYTFIYRDENMYLKTNKTPISLVIDKLQDNKLMEEVLSSKMNVDGKYTFSLLKRLKNYLSINAKDLPISIKDDLKLEVEFVKDERYQKLIRDNLINENTVAKDYLYNYIYGNRGLIYSVINHPLSRSIVFDVLKKHNLVNDIDLKDISFSYDNLFLEHKQLLKKYSNNITINSDAKSDFIDLVKNNSIDILLTKSYKDDERMVIPASILINNLEKKGIETNITFKLDDNSQDVSITYKDKEKNNTSVNALDQLIRLAKDNGILDEFIVNDEIKYYAQNSLFSKNIYPRMYINTWKYTFKSDKEDLLNNNNVNADEFLEQRKNKYKITSMNKYLTYSEVFIYNLIDKQGFLSYSPITIAKNLSKKALLEIEESIPKNIGVEITTQPNRYYPFGNFASHVLGYIGPISDNQINKEYIEYKKYDINDFIGKTGLEESFEDTLRGSKGKKLVYTDVYGSTTDVIEEIESVPGNNLFTTIDSNVQSDMQNIIDDFIYSINNNVSYNSFNGKEEVFEAKNAKVAGSILMNVKTGEIIAMYSYPDYNPNLFVNGISEYDWEKLNVNDDEDIYSPRPLLNSIIQSANPPGSTFKTVTSLAALQKGMNPNDTINSFGYIEVGNQKFMELSYARYGQVWGRINLYEALKVSSNYYFYALGYGSNPNDSSDNVTEVGLEDIYNTTKKLGMHEKTNIEINVPVESNGQHPSLEGKKDLVYAQLSGFLDRNLSKYSKTKKTEDDIISDKKEILSWVDKAENNSRSDVINGLEKLGYDATKQLDGTIAGLADIIKYSYLNMAVWTKSDSLNMVIGQGQNAYTPIQLVRLAATIANKGIIPKPTLVKKIMNYDDTKTLFENSPSSKNSDIDKKYFEDVIEGMRQASTTQSSRKYFPFEIGSKTGTAELSLTEKGSDSLRQMTSEMAFAPLDDPEIAVYTFIFDGNVSSNARIINNDIIYSYYKNVKKDSRFLAKRGDERITSPEYAFYNEEQRKQLFGN